MIIWTEASRKQQCGDGSVHQRLQLWNRLPAIPQARKPTHRKGGQFGRRMPVPAGVQPQVRLRERLFFSSVPAAGLRWRCGAETGSPARARVPFAARADLRWIATSDCHFILLNKRYSSDCKPLAACAPYSSNGQPRQEAGRLVSKIDDFIERSTVTRRQTANTKVKYHSAFSDIFK